MDTRQTEPGWQVANDCYVDPPTVEEQRQRRDQQRLQRTQPVNQLQQRHPPPVYYVGLDTKFQEYHFAQQSESPVLEPPVLESQSPMAAAPPPYYNTYPATSSLRPPQTDGHNPMYREHHEHNEDATRLGRRSSVFGKVKHMFGRSKSRSRPPSPEHGLEKGYPKFLPPRRSSTSAPDEELKALEDYDTIFVIDDSGSMKLSTSNHITPRKTHWDECKEVLGAIVEICARFDENGVDIYFFNAVLEGKFIGENIKDPCAVMDIFEARQRGGIKGSTPTAEALKVIIDPYIQECEAATRLLAKLPKPRNIIIMTDGESNNNRKLLREIVDYARRLDKIHAPLNQLGLQFFQVGDMEGVGDYLALLDNALKEEHNVRDMVDTRSTEEIGPKGLTGRRVLTTVLGAVNRRLDREMV